MNVFIEKKDIYTLKGEALDTLARGALQTIGTSCDSSLIFVSTSTSVYIYDPHYSMKELTKPMIHNHIYPKHIINIPIEAGAIHCIRNCIICSLPSLIVVTEGAEVRIYFYLEPNGLENPLIFSNIFNRRDDSTWSITSHPQRAIVAVGSNAHTVTLFDLLKTPCKGTDINFHEHQHYSVPNSSTNTLDRWTRALERFLWRVEGDTSNTTTTTMPSSGFRQLMNDLVGASIDSRLIPSSGRQTSSSRDYRSARTLSREAHERRRRRHRETYYPRSPSTDIVREQQQQQQQSLSQQDEATESQQEHEPQQEIQQEQQSQPGRHNTNRRRINRQEFYYNLSSNNWHTNSSNNNNITDDDVVAPHENRLSLELSEHNNTPPPPPSSSSHPHVNFSSFSASSSSHSNTDNHDDDNNDDVIIESDGDDYNHHMDAPSLTPNISNPYPSQLLTNNTSVTADHDTITTNYINDTIPEDATIQPDSMQEDSQGTETFSSHTSYPNSQDNTNDIATDNSLSNVDATHVTERIMSILELIGISRMGRTVLLGLQALRGRRFGTLFLPLHPPMHYVQNQTGVRRFLGHSHNVPAVEFNPKNGSLLASASIDGTIKVWSTEQEAAMLTIHIQGWCWGVTWMPKLSALKVDFLNDILGLKDLIHYCLFYGLQLTEKATRFYNYWLTTTVPATSATTSTHRTGATTSTSSTAARTRSLSLLPRHLVPQHKYILKMLETKLNSLSFEDYNGSSFNGSGYILAFSSYEYLVIYTNLLISQIHKEQYLQSQKRKHQQAIYTLPKKLAKSKILKDITKLCRFETSKRNHYNTTIFKTTQQLMQHLGEWIHKEEKRFSSILSHSLLITENFTCTMIDLLLSQIQWDTLARHHCFSSGIISNSFCKTFSKVKHHLGKCNPSCMDPTLFAAFLLGINACIERFVTEVRLNRLPKSYQHITQSFNIYLENNPSSSSSSPSGEIEELQKEEEEKRFLQFIQQRAEDFDITLNEKYIIDQREIGYCCSSQNTTPSYTGGNEVLKDNKETNNSNAQTTTLPLMLPTHYLLYDKTLPKKKTTMIASLLNLIQEFRIESWGMMCYLTLHLEQQHEKFSSLFFALHQQKLIEDIPIDPIIKHVNFKNTEIAHTSIIRVLKSIQKGTATPSSRCVNKNNNNRLCFDKHNATMFRIMYEVLRVSFQLLRKEQLALWQVWSQQNKNSYHPKITYEFLKVFLPLCYSNLALLDTSIELLIEHPNKSLVSKHSHQNTTTTAPGAGPEDTLLHLEACSTNNVGLPILRFITKKCDDSTKSTHEIITNLNDAATQPGDIFSAAAAATALSLPSSTLTSEETLIFWKDINSLMHNKVNKFNASIANKQTNRTYSLFMFACRIAKKHNNNLQQQIGHIVSRPNINLSNSIQEDAKNYWLIGTSQHHFYFINLEPIKNKINDSDNQEPTTTEHISTDNANHNNHCTDSLLIKNDADTKEKEKLHCSQGLLECEVLLSVRVPFNEFRQTDTGRTAYERLCLLGQCSHKGLLFIASQLGFPVFVYQACRCSCTNKMFVREVCRLGSSKQKLRNNNSHHRQRHTDQCLLSNMQDEDERDLGDACTDIIPVDPLTELEQNERNPVFNSYTAVSQTSLFSPDIVSPKPSALSQCSCLKPNVYAVGHNSNELCDFLLSSKRQRRRTKLLVTRQITTTTTKYVSHQDEIEADEDDKHQIICGLTVACQKPPPHKPFHRIQVNVLLQNSKIYRYWIHVPNAT